MTSSGDIVAGKRCRESEQAVQNGLERLMLGILEITREKAVLLLQQVV